MNHQKEIEDIEKLKIEEVIEVKNRKKKTLC